MQIADAPLEWYKLQRGWWRGTKPPPTAPYPAPPHRYTIDLHEKYPFNIGGTGTGWTRSFTVPSGWTGGRKELWISSGGLGPFFLEGNQGSASIDGTNASVTAGDITAMLTPGSNHTFSVQTSGTAPVFGVAGDAWVRFIPDPVATLPLSGLQWTGSPDGITYSGASSSLPMSFNGLLSAKSSFTLDSSTGHQNDTTMLVFTKDACAYYLTQAIVNGHWVSVYYNGTGSTIRINVTPYLLWGAGVQNNVEILTANTPPTTCSGTNGLQSAELDFYTPGGIYP